MARLRDCGSFQDFPEATEIRVSTGKIEFGTITLLPMRNTCVTINHGCVPFVVNTFRHFSVMLAPDMFNLFSVV
jgi:hypothetical protein